MEGQRRWELFYLPDPDGVSKIGMWSPLAEFGFQGPGPWGTLDLGVLLSDSAGAEAWAA